MLQIFESEKGARRMARLSATVSIFIALAIIMKLALMSQYGDRLYPDEGRLAIQFLIEGFVLFLFVAATWSILRSQSRWAATLTAFWFFVEKFGNVFDLGSVPAGIAIFWGITYFLLTLCALLGVWGAWKLAALRKPPPEQMAAV